MLTTLKETWTRHDDWAPGWVIILWRVTIAGMILMIPTHAILAVWNTITQQYIDTVFNILWIGWFMFLLVWYGK